MPYTDAFDHKGPVLYLINALSFVFGNRGVWVIDVIFLVIYAFGAYITAKRYLRSYWACLVAISLVLTISNSYWIGNTPDWYSSVAILYCISLFADYYRDKDLNAKKYFSWELWRHFVFGKNSQPLVLLEYCVLEY